MKKLDQKRMKLILTTLLFVALAFGIGFVAGFDHATGSIGMGFFGGTSYSVPDDIAKRSYAEAEATIAPVANMEYTEGFNCLDFAWEAMRLLHWNGQLAMIVQLDLDPDPNHAVIIVATSDEGWVFFEPETGARIYPTVGGYYLDARIEGVYVMGISWTSMEQYLDEIATGTISTEALSYYRVND